jgi:CitMHS family citrate-Mg2+:H+ or citrate-Ca2+:H+ symporter
MLSALGYLMVASFMTLITTRWMPAVVALIIVPIVFGMIGGFGAELGPMMLMGIQAIGPTGILLMFAILYFGLMIDAGLFDPIVRGLLAVVKGDPVKVVIGTVLLASFVSLDGDGSTTYMVTTAALLPLYKRLGLKPLIMTCLIMLCSGVFNITPWGGPTARVAAALHLDAGDIFVPMIPAMALAIVFLCGVAYLYGRSERKRLGVITLGPIVSDPADPPDDISELSATPSGAVTVSTDPAACRPRLFWVNAILTIGLLALLIIGAIPLPVLFMCGFAIAATINYPRFVDLRARMAAHAPNVLAVVSLIFAAGIFTGILSGTGMVQAMSQTLIDIIPASMGAQLGLITGLISLPATFFMSNDAFYFGVVPILAEAASHHGISPIAIASASLVGQPVHLLSPLVASTYLLVSLGGVDFGDHQRFTFGWAAATSLVLLLGVVLLGVVPLGL